MSRQTFFNIQFILYDSCICTRVKKNYVICLPICACFAAEQLFCKKMNVGIYNLQHFGSLFCTPILVTIKIEVVIRNCGKNMFAKKSRLKNSKSNFKKLAEQ